MASVCLSVCLHCWVFWPKMSTSEEGGPSLRSRSPVIFQALRWGWQPGWRGRGLARAEEGGGRGRGMGLVVGVARLVLQVACGRGSVGAWLASLGGGVWGCWVGRGYRGCGLSDLQVCGRGLTGLLAAVGVAEGDTRLCGGRGLCLAAAVGGAGGSVGAWRGRGLPGLQEGGGSER
jgi:hypothetical protein